VRPRFAGEIAEIATVPAEHPDPDTSLPPEQRYLRPISFGDRVKAGDLLAVVWSKDLGDKKAALIDALIDLRRDRQRLEELNKVYEKGGLSAAVYYEAQRTVEKDAHAAVAAERTLRMWKVDDKQIGALTQEAQALEG